MSLFDYRQSKQLAEIYPTFAALIMAAMRKADTENTRRLQEAFPQIYDELWERYNVPSGVLTGDPEQ